MPFEVPMVCPVCEAEHGVEGSWDTHGDNDCPKCGAKGVIYIGWETEFDLEPVEDET